ncbi:hypothetical protein MMC07_007807 [Pseudocyphellaria aurata]|nr:hypothetical protein [Pseudocyphellaria aurata]
MPAHNTRSHKKAVRFAEDPLRSGDVGPPVASVASGSTRSAAGKGTSKGKETAAEPTRPVVRVGDFHS